MFVLDPLLLLEGPAGSIVLGVISALLGVVALGMGTMGYFTKRTTMVERALLIAGAVCLLHPELITDLAGIALIGVTWFIQRFLRHAENP